MGTMYYFTTTRLKHYNFCKKFAYALFTFVTQSQNSTSIFYITSVEVNYGQAKYKDRPLNNKLTLHYENKKYMCVLQFSRKLNCRLSGTESHEVIGIKQSLSFLLTIGGCSFNRIKIPSFFLPTLNSYVCFLFIRLQQTFLTYFSLLLSWNVPL